jgi:hypothetical protein
VPELQLAAALLAGPLPDRAMAVGLAAERPSAASRR